MLIKHACFSYLPQRYHKSASFEEIDLAYKLHAFKDGRLYAKRWAANVVCDTLSLIDMTDTIFLCIPASCQHTPPWCHQISTTMWCDHSTKIRIYNPTHPEERITTLTAHAVHTVIPFTPMVPYLRGVTLLSGENGAGGRTDVFTIHKWAAQWPA